MTVRELAALVLLVAGIAIEVVCCLGVAIMRGPYDKLHYAGAAALGAALVAAAVTVAESFSLIADKALVTAAFLLATGPVLVHATGRAAHGREQAQRRGRSDAEDAKP